MFMYVIVWCLFFCKQKTAYEMRISDWSSDVCSSDLRSSAGRRAGTRGGTRTAPSATASAGPCSAAWRTPQAPAPGSVRCLRAWAPRASTDRKSVVSGKSVSVRVDLGGTSLIEKTKKHKEHTKRKQQKTKPTQK